MKKIISILLAAVMVMALLAGCGSKNKDHTNDNNTPNNNQTTELSGSVATNGSTSMDKVIGALREQFMTDHKNVTVTYDPTGSGSGIEAVKHSGDYFSGEQLDVIAGGGTFIFIQDSSAGVPYVRHQLTTDMSTTEMCELSLVKNFDYVSYCCRDAMAPFIGKYNIVPSTLASCRTSLAATLESLKLDNQPKIGARVLAYSIESVAQLESDRTRIEMYANVTFPYPLNTIGLHIVSQ